MPASAQDELAFQSSNYKNASRTFACVKGMRDLYASFSLALYIYTCTEHVRELYSLTQSVTGVYSRFTWSYTEETRRQ